ncbi:unconventional myosin-XVB [Rhinoraja longicauda]
MLQMDVKKKLLVGMKVKAKGGSQGTVQSELKPKSKTREKFSKVHLQQRYQARMCKVVGRSSAEKQCIKEGGESGEEQSLGKLTVVQTFPSARLLSHQAHLIHSLRTKSKDIRTRSNRTLAVGSGKNDLSPLPEVAIKSHQGAPVKEVLADQTPVKRPQKERRREGIASDVESHDDGDQQASAQQLMALAHKKKIAKVVGKVKLASVRKSTAKTRRTEEITAAENLTEAEPGSTEIKKSLCQRFSVIRRVTGWISRQIPKVLKTRSKLVTVTHVIGTTEWIAKTLSMKRKNKEGKRCNFRRRMAIRLASTAGLASRGGHCPWNKSEALKEETKEDGGLLQVTESVHSADDAQVSVDIQPVTEVKANTQDISHQSEGQTEAEEKLGNSDARYAIVLPRVHQLVKSKATVLASCRSERNHADSPQPYKAAVPAQPGPSIMGLVRKSQNEPRGKLHTLRDFGQSNSERNGSNLQPRDTQSGPHYLQTDTSTRPMNKALMKDQNSKQFTLSDSQALPTSQMRTDPCQPITSVQDDKYFQDGKEIHWARRGHFNNDHLTWLDSETLLPHLTIENLSKWTMYKEQGVVRTQRRTGTWEPEDIAENILEKDFTLKQPTFKKGHEPETKEVEDLSNLEEVCESSVLLCLKRRFHRDINYTYIGNILISLNPYKCVGIYSMDIIKQYKRKELTENPPHIFAIADAAYTLSQSCEREQCIIVSGQSGSGKTEAAKLITRYLMALYQETREEQICQAAQALPILEAFGNAKTVLNNNSSRFGKLLWIHIRDDLVVGNSISHYLLEKSRLVFQARGERNYHVFYELLAGLDEEQKQELSLQEAETYFYLNQGGVCEISSKNEHKDFMCLLHSLGRIGLLEDQLMSVWSILSSILQLGNVCFTSYEDGSQELAVIVSHTETRIVANLLQVSLDTLNSVITQRMTETSYDRIFSPLSVESSIDARDTIGKALYSLLFDWLVQQINECLMPAEMDSSVGVVDIYGFEDLGVNSFEQLCINYANEQLQQFFSQAVLSQEQEEYSREQIGWAFVPVSDRQNCLNLITAKPYGILRILDDQTSLPQATDHTFLQKCHYQHGNNPWYVKPKLPLPVFTIRHYAGAVTYQVHKFLDKNRDQLRTEVMEIFIHSRNKIISDLFKRAQESLHQQKRIRCRGRGLRNQSPTVAAKFQNSLLELIARLGRCNPLFIRCIKPNNKKIPGLFDVECVGAQLRHSGIMEAIHIRKEGYPIRIPLSDFTYRYSMLLDREKEWSSDSELCSSILRKITKETSGSYQLGVTKVFLKKDVFNQLESYWAKMQNWAALTIQRNIRGFIKRRNFQVFRQKIVIAQSHIRGHQASNGHRLQLLDSGRRGPGPGNNGREQLAGSGVEVDGVPCRDASGPSLPHVTVLLRVNGSWPHLWHSMARGVAMNSGRAESAGKLLVSIYLKRCSVGKNRTKFNCKLLIKTVESKDTRSKRRGGAVGMDVGLLEIPAELAALLRLADALFSSIPPLSHICCSYCSLQVHREICVGHLEINSNPSTASGELKFKQFKKDLSDGSLTSPSSFMNQVTEVSPPQVKAIINHSLPADLNDHPFSKFINDHFQVPQFQALDQALQQPLTQLERTERHAALELFKLRFDEYQNSDQGLSDMLMVLRFQQEESIQSRKETILGNFIVQKGISNPRLQDEIYCQMANQTWKNRDMEEWRRACLLLTTCLSCLRPSPRLEKPLLKYVSDLIMEEYRAVCQHKALSAMQCIQNRAFPPTQLEWTANHRRGQMVLDVHVSPDETFATEVESWTTGEELGNWILKSRGQEEEQRGWTVSLHTAAEWRDMLGCDFVMDLIAETENLNVPLAQTSSSIIHSQENGSNYESHPTYNDCYASRRDVRDELIPPAPNVQAPALPPSMLSYDSDSYMYACSSTKSETSQGFENYVDNLFDPVFSHGGGEMQQTAALNRRMKGRGGIGPTQSGAYMTTGVPMVPSYSMGIPMMPQMPQMATVPAYQTQLMGAVMPAMQPMHAMPQMPAMQPMHAMPQMAAMQPVPMMQPMETPMPVMMIPQASMPQMQPMHPTSHYPRSQFSQPANQYNSSQLSEEQERLMNQQALLLAQQMTSQALSISQQQQRQILSERQEEPRQEQQHVSKITKTTTTPKAKTKPIPPDSPPEKPSKKKKPIINENPPEVAEKPSRDTVVLTANEDFEEVDLEQFETFQQKRTFFQKIGQKKSLKLNNPSKILLPKPEKTEEKQEVEESSSSTVGELEDSPSPPPPPPPPPVKLTKDSQHKKERKKDEQNVEEENKPETSVQRRRSPRPSHNIREIIQKYQSRPVSPPPVYKPNRVRAKPFLKKDNPKNEALSLLGMAGSASPPEDDTTFPGMEGSAPKVPPKPAPKPQSRPLSSQSSIHEQLRLLLTPKGIHPPSPPPPPPPPPLPSNITSPTPTNSTEFQLSPASPKSETVSLQDENIKTQLYRRTASVYFSYINIPWKLYLRKELFYPREKFNSEYILDLLCEQIMQDTYSNTCSRISKEERNKMRNLLAELHVGTNVRMLQDNGLKKRIVVAARDNWAVYFSRLFSVSGDVGSNVEILSVSHRGIKLLKSVKTVGMNPEHYKVLQSYSYVEILNVELQGEAVIELTLKNEELVLYSDKAKQAKALIGLFLEELRKDSNYVMAVRSYITDDKSLLNFRKGDIIKLLQMDGLEPGWQFGSIGGRSGLFPGDQVQPVAAPDYYNVNMRKVEERPRTMSTSSKSSTKKSATPSEVSGSGDGSTTISSHSPPNSYSLPEEGYYVMTEFAMKYFREPTIIPEWKDGGAEGTKPNHLVRHTKVPIQDSLIYIVDIERNELATQNFMALMRFMGDQPLQKKHSCIDHIQSILKLCKENTLLLDEVCCQIIKQITDNPKNFPGFITAWSLQQNCHYSSQPALHYYTGPKDYLEHSKPIRESCILGWRILYIFLGYYPCTVNLAPYVSSYLQDILINPNHPFQEIARFCQENIQRTFQFGGRQHLPTSLEIEALIKGRSTRRISVQMPGNLEQPFKIKPFLVGSDLLMEICATIGITDTEEAKDFSLFADKDNGKVVKPIRWDEYLFDFLLDDNSVRFQFQRIIWKEPLRFYNDLNVDLHYNQVLPTYLKGQLILPKDIYEAEQYVAKLAAYQHKSTSADPEPTGQQLKTYLPKPAMGQVNFDAVLRRTLQELDTMHHLSPVEAKKHFLTAVCTMPLFGYNIFPVKKTSQPWIPAPCLIAFNQEILMVLSEEAKNELLTISLRKILMMHTRRTLDGSSFPLMDINYGSSDKPQKISFEVKEAKKISHMIGMILDGVVHHSYT